MDRFEVLEHVGSGTFGDVLRVRQKRTGEVFAMKKVKCCDVAEANFAIREAWHINKDCMYAVCLVMQYCPEGDLGSLIEKYDGSIPAEVLCHLLSQVADALATLHARRLTHRDVKPQNILLTGGRHTALLADFGLVRTVSRGSRMSSVTGTQAYMAPEQIRGTSTEAVDLWALGCLMYEMIVPDDGAFGMLYLENLELGDVEFQRQVGAKMRAENYNESLVSLTLQLLSRDPAQRPTAAQVAWRLRALLPSLPEVHAPIQPQITNQTMTQASGTRRRVRHWGGGSSPPAANTTGGVGAQRPRFGLGLSSVVPRVGTNATANHSNEAARTDSLTSHSSVVGISNGGQVARNANTTPAARMGSVGSHTTSGGSAGSASTAGVLRVQLPTPQSGSVYPPVVAVPTTPPNRTAIENLPAKTSPSEVANAPVTAAHTQRNEGASPHPFQSRNQSVGSSSSSSTTVRRRPPSPGSFRQRTTPPPPLDGAYSPHHHPNAPPQTPTPQITSNQNQHQTHAEMSRPQTQTEVEVRGREIQNQLQNQHRAAQAEPNSGSPHVSGQGGQSFETTSTAYSSASSCSSLAHYAEQRMSTPPPLYGGSSGHRPNREWLNRQPRHSHAEEPKRERDREVISFTHDAIPRGFLGIARDDVVTPPPLMPSPAPSLPPSPVLRSPPVSGRREHNEEPLPPTVALVMPGESGTVSTGSLTPELQWPGVDDVFWGKHMRQPSDSDSVALVGHQPLASTPTSADIRDRVAKREMNDGKNNGGTLKSNGIGGCLPTPPRMWEGAPAQHSLAPSPPLVPGGAASGLGVGVSRAYASPVSGSPALTPSPPITPPPPLLPASAGGDVSPELEWGKNIGVRVNHRNSGHSGKVGKTMPPPYAGGGRKERARAERQVPLNQTYTKPPPLLRSRSPMSLPIGAEFLHAPSSPMLNMQCQGFHSPSSPMFGQAYGMHGAWGPPSVPMVPVGMHRGLMAMGPVLMFGDDAVPPYGM